MTVKRILYASHNSLCVSVYDGRAFLGELVFAVDEAGMAAFRDYLCQEPDIITHLVMDMIEEEYRNETIPHLIGRDRSSVVARRLEQAFRTTPYRAAQIQGRMKEGRRDDRVLLTALTNPDAIAAIIAPLTEHKVPLAGICSAPMLAALLLRRIDITADNTLLLTRNRHGFLRQTFMHRHELKNSRLSPLAAGEYGPELLAQEIEKNRRYLNRLRLLAQDAPLDVVIVDEREFIGQLRATWQGTDSLRYHLVDFEAAALAVGMADGSSPMDCERLFVHLLSLDTPAVNYAQTADRRIHRLYQTRKALLAGSLGMLLGGAAWAGVNVMDGVALDREAEAALKTLESLRADYDSAVAGRPSMDIGVDEMRWMVDAGESVARSNTRPWPMLRALSAGVSSHPAIRIDEIVWTAAHQDGDINPEDLGMFASQDAAASSGESAIIKGRLEAFDGDLRAAFNRVDGFVETLRRDGRFSTVDAVEMPLNVDPDATVAGIAGTLPDDAAATFEIRVMLRAGHEGV
ncbi:MAG: hypothetical protein IPK65_05325 [Gammaproteobacteria bacterium]|nr:hypothetical protein [Gammaproteobacteria bacterium]